MKICRRTVPLALAAAAIATFAAVRISHRGEARAEAAMSDGVVRVRSGYSHAETVDRLKKDVEGKGIRFFMKIEQSELAKQAGIDLRPSTLVVFGNPALGSLFITANPLAGLDWPVRVLVHTDQQGQVWAAYSDFEWVARRHHIVTGLEPFRKATGVIGSIMASIAAPAAAR